jgi:anti-sigma regulatory factor (Ser/Thr protein kinase)
MSEHLQKSRLVHRSSYCRKIKLFLDSEEILTGITKDISPHSLSMFISLKGAIPYLENKGLLKDKKISLNKIKKFLQNETVLISFEDDKIKEPIDIRILRIESSWKKGYEIFIAGQFENIDEFIAKGIENYCPEEKGKVDKKKYISTKIPHLKEFIEEDHPNKLNFDFNNSYSHVILMRDFIASLAEKYNFSAEDVYFIKLIADEVLMNAFLYGSTIVGRDKTLLNIIINSQGIIVEVTDFAGVYFDDTPYHVRKELSLKQLGGLALIEAYSDDWQVDIENNVQTTLTFCKSNTALNSDKIIQ